MIATSEKSELCACGKPLHYANPVNEAYVRREVERLGSTVPVCVGALGWWSVPRHYIALHGISGNTVPILAAKYGWEKLCTDGKQHTWQTMNHGAGSSYSHCPVCGAEKGRIKNPPDQCPP